MVDFQAEPTTCHQSAFALDVFATEYLYYSTYLVTLIQDCEYGTRYCSTPVLNHTTPRLSRSSIRTGEYK
jgi:hypothetical protein